MGGGGSSGAGHGGNRLEFRMGNPAEKQTPLRLWLTGRGEGGTLAIIILRWKPTNIGDARRAERGPPEGTCGVRLARPGSAVVAHIYFRPVDDNSGCQGRSKSVWEACKKEYFIPGLQVFLAAGTDLRGHLRYLRRR